MASGPSRGSKSSKRPGAAGGGKRPRPGPTARGAASAALAQFARHYPDVPITEVDPAGLSDADARLASAIHRLGVQRWLTLSHLLNRLLKKPLARLEPAMAGVLVGGAAQLVFMDKVPAYAVVDESARLARSMVRPGAAGLANAVLRGIAAAVAGRADQPWTPARDALPLGAGVGVARNPTAATGQKPPAQTEPRHPTPDTRSGGVVRLASPMLPKVDNLVEHLEAAASVPRALLSRWVRLYGIEETRRLALHALSNPPTFVIEGERPRVWTGPRERLAPWLAEDPARRVQDPASLAPLAAAARWVGQPAAALDLCAGRGTKTRQLQALFPQAAITAWDLDPARRGDLPHGVTVAEPRGRYDLVVLDVPCSNTGVLARRPGARYRFTDRHRRELDRLQRRIIDRGASHAAAGGFVLYCTCSIDPEENQRQARALLERVGGESAGAAIVSEELMLPGGVGGDYHDGSYHALVKLPEER